MSATPHPERADDRRVVVVGSGPAGASAAWALVRRGVPVTLLEAGGDFQPGFLLRLGGRNLLRRAAPMVESKEHVVSGDPRTQWWYNLALGGLSNQWTGAVPRFAPQDLTDGERLHERYRWPVDYEDLEPYYAQVEPLMDITADSRDVPNLPAGCAAHHHRLPDDWLEVDRVANRHGHALTTMPLADGPPNLLVGRGAAFNSYSVLLRPLLRSSHFTLQTRATVLRLEWNPALGRVDGVVYHDGRTGQERRIGAAAVVVACGALHSTRLLFNSACPDFPEGLGNADGLLGRYLHDHPREWWAFDSERPMTLLAPPAYLTRLPYDASPPLLATSWTMGTVGLRDKVLSRFGQKGHTAGVQIFGTMVPTEDRFARPDPQRRDAFGMPLLDLHIHFDDDEVRTVERARQHLMDLMAESGNPSTLREVDPTLFPGTSVHYGGSVRMHRKRAYGVLDPWNRIWDAPNVVVCDASCFTTGAEKNPTLTMMALAVRAADRLAHDLKTGDAHAA